MAALRRGRPFCTPTVGSRLIPGTSGGARARERERETEGHGESHIALMEGSSLPTLEGSDPIKVTTMLNDKNSAKVDPEALNIKKKVLSLPLSLCLSVSLPAFAPLPLCLSASLPLCPSAPLPLCLSASLPLFLSRVKPTSGCESAVTEKGDGPSLRPGLSLCFSVWVSECSSPTRRRRARLLCGVGPFRATVCRPCGEMQNFMRLSTHARVVDENSFR